MRKVVKKKVSERTFGGGIITSGEEKKEKYEKEEGAMLGTIGNDSDGGENEIGDRKESERKEGGGRLREDIRRKVRRKLRRRERVENSGSSRLPQLDEASLKNLARQEVSAGQDVSPARRVNSFSSKNSAVRRVGEKASLKHSEVNSWLPKTSTTPKSPRAGIKQVFLFTTNIPSMYKSLLPF